MTEDAFVSMLSLGERPSVEFKGPGTLKDVFFLARVARAVLALSNHRDGGIVALGIEDPNNAVGLTDVQLADWRNRDHVFDALNAYAAPGVEIELDYEPAARKCVMIHVKQFRSQPVICKQGCQDKKDILLRKGALYCRPLNGRPRSVEASDPELLRDVLDLSLDLQIRAFIARSLKAGTLLLAGAPAPAPADEAQFKKQRGDF